MNPMVVYCSVRGHTRQVAEAMDLPCFDVVSNPSLEGDPILFFCPTYGDEELPPEMEDFVSSTGCTGKEYGICELGNYYGFEDYQFGAAKIIKHELDRQGWKNTIPNLSLDSLPRIDWKSFYEWKANVQKFFYNR